MSCKEEGLRIDIGCGSIKKEGTLGVDSQALPEVDYVVDIEKEPLPFADRSVVYTHSSHFLEHVQNPATIFAEISRVCAENARLELWTPYAWSNTGFILGHKTFFTEDIYLHMCVWFTDFWRNILGARWILREFQYSVDGETLSYLKANRIGLDFALRHLHNIAYEFCAHINVLHSDLEARSPLIRRTFSTGRSGPRYEVLADEFAPPFERIKGQSSDMMVNDAIRAFAKGSELPPFQ